MAEEEAQQGGSDQAPEQLVRIAARTPAEVCQELDLSEEALAHLEGGPGPTAFLTALLQEELLQDAVHYLANALPHRETVAWACRCARHVFVGELSPEDEAALAAAEAWVQAPDQDACDAAGAAAEETGLEGMACFAALAAQYTGESMTGPELPAVPPPPELIARAAAGSIFMAAAEGDPEEMDNRFKSCLALGIELARLPPT